MKNVLPVVIFAMLVLIYPHGMFENLAMAGVIVTGVIALYRTFKRDTFATHLQKELRKKGISAEVRRLPNGKTLADVLEELANKE